MNFAFVHIFFPWECSSDDERSEAPGYSDNNVLMYHDVSHMCEDFRQVVRNSKFFARCLTKDAFICVYIYVHMVSFFF